MASALDYLSWRGDIPFESVPPCEVDLFLCSQIVTPDYTGIVPESGEAVPLPDAVEQYFATHEDNVRTLGALQSKKVLPMLHALPTCPRFAALCLTDYVCKISTAESEQFCALTLVFPNGDICVCYQGTDDTIIGWKEDFSLAVPGVVPAQKDAVAYLESAARCTEGKIYVCGHSKGGNLAVYAAVCSSPEIRDRVAAVYSFDGPGFQLPFFDEAGYPALQEKIHTVLSKNALVGMLMQPAGTRHIVETRIFGPLAHDGFAWQVLGATFVRAPAFGKSSVTFDRTMDKMMQKLSPAEIAEFNDVFFGTLLDTGAVTVSDLTRLHVDKTFTAIRTLYKQTPLARYAIMALNILLRSATETASDKKEKAAKKSSKSKERITK